MGKGALVFKGDDSKAKKKKKTVKHCSSQEQADGTVVTTASSSTLSAQTAAIPVVAAASAAVVPPKIQEGKGKITTSGTVVMGHVGTQFTRQLRAGDAMLVGAEMRVVTMCLSDISINLSSAFSKNVVQPTSFQFISKPRSIANPQITAAQKRQQEEEESKLASGTYASVSSSSRELVYREKTEQGSYRIRTQLLDHDATRGEMLELRAKKKRDKHC